MKCDDCLNLLETYLDGEATEREAEALRNHLITCAACENQFEAFTAENESYAHYDREIQVSPAIWSGITASINAEERQAQRKSKFNFAEWLSGLFAIPSVRFAMPAVALVAFAVVVGLAFWKTRPQQPPPLRAAANTNSATPLTPGGVESRVDTAQNGSQEKPKDTQRPIQLVAYKDKRPTVRVTHSTDQNDVLPDTDPANNDIEDRDTANHLEQAQNLLTSFRNIKYSDTDEEVDVSFEKAESKRLLGENVLLRRDAEQAGKYPAKSMLGSLEPFLIDIANLPDKAKPADVRQITDRVQRTEIVAELRGY
jgi:hypothetical protein